MIVPLHRCRTAEVIHGARNDTTFAPFVKSLFPIDSSKMLEAQNLPADRSREFSSAPVLKVTSPRIPRSRRQTAGL